MVPADHADGRGFHRNFTAKNAKNAKNITKGAA